MRIAVLFRTTDGPWGGGNSFLRALIRHWRAQHVEVVDHLEAGLDGVLLSSSYRGRLARLDPRAVERMVKYGTASALPSALAWSRWRGGFRPPFVHRLDGVFRLYGRAAGDPADVAQLEINRWVDWTIYQSEFCRESFAAEGADVSLSTVIVNGVDLDVFFPAQRTPPASPLKLIMVSWSPNLRKGAPAAVAASRLPDIEVTFIGNWPPGLEPERVKILSPLRHEALAERLRSHHAMLHMAENDPCSNAILEAMACGLPVVYHPSGGSPEIVAECGVPCARGLSEALAQLRDRYGLLRDRTIARRLALSIARPAGEYLSVFERVGPVRSS